MDNYFFSSLKIYFKNILLAKKKLGLNLLENFTDYQKLFIASEKNFKKIITPYKDEFRWPIGQICNTQFESVDVELYYSMIRYFKPNLIIEIGSGNSTYFALDAIKKNQKGQIICIDPEPRKALPKEIKHIPLKVEDIKLTFFKTLAKNDILFIDSSHTTKEAKYHTRKIFPKLCQGVVIHHHDFAYPYDSHYMNDPKFDEPEILLNFYKNHPSYKIITCASYIYFTNLRMMRNLISSLRWSQAHTGGSLWVKKVK